MKIIIELYSEENPFSFYYKTSLSKEQLNNLHQNFNSYTDITDIYEDINDIISEDDYDIKIEEGTNNKVFLILKVNYDNIYIKLSKDKNNIELPEFIKGFYQEFVKFKNDTNFVYNKEYDDINELKEENIDIKIKTNEVNKEKYFLKKKLINITNNIIRLNNDIDNKNSLNINRNNNNLNESNKNKNNINRFKK